MVCQLKICMKDLYEDLYEVRDLLKVSVMDQYFLSNSGSKFEKILQVRFLCVN
jgi:hypothetical protein